MPWVDRPSGVALALVATALIAHVAALWSQQAVNLDGSHSSLAPAAPQRVALELTVYYASTAALIATYAGLLFLVIRGRVRGVARTVLLAAPVLLQLVLFLQRPWLSTDVLSYIAQGWLGTAAGGNPYTDVPRDVLGTVIGNQLTALGWRPQTILSPYGPLWTIYETVVVSLTHDLSPAILLMKLAPFAASLGSAVLIWQILGRAQPRLQLLGTVAFLWNPVVLSELAAEGHVDGVMVFLVLLGLAATLRASVIRGTVAGGLAAMTKYVTVMLLPAQAVYLWRTGPRPAELRRRVAVGALVAGGLVVALFAPFWVGLRTLEGLRVMGQPGPWPTVTGFIYRYLERAWPGVDGGTVAAILVTGGFAAYLLHAALGVRDARSLLVASARTALAFTLVASPVFYPWYAVLPIALLALVPETSYLVLILALTTMSRVVAPLVDLRPAYEPIPSAAYTLTSVGLFACIAVVVGFGVRAVWAWAAREHEESTAPAS